MYFPIFLREFRPGRENRASYTLVGLASFILLLLSMYRLTSFGHGVEEANRVPIFYNLSAVEKQKDFSTGAVIYFAWSNPALESKVAKPISTLRLPRLQRSETLYLTLKMSLDRPVYAPPARVEINLLGDKEVKLTTLGVFEADPARPGFQEYQVEIPPAEGKQGVTVQISSNPFVQFGQAGVNGVKISSYRIEQRDYSYFSYFWPDPFIPAALILIGGVLYWAWKVKLSLFELASTLGPLAFVAGTLAYYNRTFSWFSLGSGLVLFLSAFLWQRSKILFLPLALKEPLEFLPFLLALAGIAGFFINGFSYMGDIWFYNNWIDCEHTKGLFNFYNNCPFLDYPPLTPYLLYFYGILAYPGGFAGNPAFLKGFFALTLVFMAYIIWRFSRRKGQNFNSNQRGAVLVLFGFNAAVLYNPVIWGQLDGGPTLFLLLAFTLIFSRRPYLGGTALGLAIIFKPQAIFAVPVLGILLLKKEGWKKTSAAAALSLTVLLALSIPAFGFDWNSFLNNYWLRNEMAGDKMDMYLLQAYNFSYLLDFPANHRFFIILAGFLIIILVYLLIIGFTWFKNANERDTAIAVAVGVFICFAFAIKMHERYTYYALPFLALAVLYDRRASKIWGVASFVSLYQVVISPLPTYRANQIPHTFFLWHLVLENIWNWLPTVLSLATIGAAFGLLVFYLLPWPGNKKRGETLFSEEEKPALLEPARLPVLLGLGAGEPEAGD